MSSVDLRWVTPIAKIKGGDRKDSRLLKRDARYARDFIETRPWYGRIEGEYFAYGVGGVAAVFLFHVHDERDQALAWVWVIQGDLPAAEVRDESTPMDALRAYIRKMREWAEAVRAGRSVEDLVPVNAAPTLEWADELESRLQFLEENFFQDEDGQQ